jgi:hypothetical protein
MEMQHLACLLAVAVGIVSSGLVSSLWEIATEEDLHLGDILDPAPTLLTPLRVLAVVWSAPMIVLVDAFWWLIAKPLFGVPLVAAGLLWSFLQGVFILTKVFGFP